MSAKYSNYLFSVINSDLARSACMHYISQFNSYNIWKCGLFLVMIYFNEKDGLL